MPRHALAFRVRPGTETEVAALLADYQPPELEIDENTRLLGTAVFMQGDLVIRVMDVEGDLATVGRHLSQDPGIRKVEDALSQYLANSFAPGDPKARGQLLARRLMDPITHRDAGDLE